MVHPEEDKNNALHQFREQPTKDAVAPPYPGEVIGGRKPYEAVGLDALSPIVGAVSFPATKEEVVAQIGHAVIPVGKFRTVSAREIIERTAPNEFRSSMELEEAVKRIMDSFVPQGERGSHHRQRDDVRGREPQA